MPWLIWNHTTKAVQNGTTYSHPKRRRTTTRSLGCRSSRAERAVPELVAAELPGPRKA
jgi:hypothetical protein